MCLMSYPLALNNRTFRFKSLLHCNKLHGEAFCICGAWSTPVGFYFRFLVE